MDDAEYEARWKRAGFEERDRLISERVRPRAQDPPPAQTGELTALMTPVFDQETIDQNETPRPRHVRN
jgi:hypothetical protein